MGEVGYGTDRIVSVQRRRLFRRAKFQVSRNLQAILHAGNTAIALLEFVLKPKTACNSNCDGLNILPHFFVGKPHDRPASTN
jgi:hypothetical protein